MSVTHDPAEIRPELVWRHTQAHWRMDLVITAALIRRDGTHLLQIVQSDIGGTTHSSASGIVVPGDALRELHTALTALIDTQEI